MKKKIFIAFMAGVIAVGAWMWSRQGPFVYAGTVEATEVDIAARLAAPIAQLMVNEGDLVPAGSPVARLDGADVGIALTYAQRDYQRGVLLHRQGSLSDEGLDRLAQRRDETALRSQWCELVAPSTGVVLRRYREPGEWVVPGQKIMTLADLRSLSVVVYVPAPVMARRALEDRVSVFVPDLDNTLTGTVVRIRNEAEFTPKNVQTRSERERLVFGIKIALPNDPQGYLKPGMSVEVSFPEDARG